MKTPKEIEEKYEELNQRMSSMMPDEKSIRELRDCLASDDPKARLDMFAKTMMLSSDTVSTDAQRYILEWVLGHHE